MGLLPDTQNCGCACAGNAGNVSPWLQVSDPDMHNGTCVTHVPWCMPGPLTSGFLWNRRRGKTLPAFPAHVQPAILRIWYEAHGGYPIVIARDENTVASGDQGDMLLVKSDCLWTWILYTSPDNLPVGAVVAGNDVRKEPLYAARAEFDGIFIIGYYKSDTQLGYFTVDGVETTMLMEFLVILWSLI